MTFEQVFTIKDLLWHMLDFLALGTSHSDHRVFTSRAAAEWSDVINVLWLSRNIQVSCHGYVLKHDWIHPEFAGPFRYRKSVIRSAGALKALVSGVRELSVGDLALVPGALPEGVQKLTILSIRSELDAGGLPQSLTGLEIIVNGPGSALRGSLPPGLQKLRITSGCIRLGAGLLPPGLRSLETWDSIRVGILPAGLQALTMWCYQPLVGGFLPAGLQELSIGTLRSETWLTPGALPASLRKLSVRTNSPFRVQDLPAGLQELHYDPWSGDPTAAIDLKGLPAGLHVLTLPRGSSQKFEKGDLPPGLRVLRTDRTPGPELTLPEGCRLERYSAGGGYLSL